MRWLAFLCCFLTASSATASNFKIATVDMGKLFKEYPGTRQAEKELAAFSKKKQRELADSQEILADFQKVLNGSKGKLSRKEKALTEKEFEAQTRKFEDEKNNMQDELAERDSAMTRILLDQIRDLVATVARKEGVDLVLDTNNVAGVNKIPDLTAEVLKAFPRMDSDPMDSNSKKP
jgi:outer membrane protein